MRLLAVIAFLLLPLSAAAQGTPELMAENRDWEAYRYESDGQTVCYALSRPKTLAPTNRNHGDIFFFVSHWPEKDVEKEASFLAGYPFEEGSSVTVDVDGQEFTMFTNEDGAWVESVAEERDLIAAMRAGRRMTVKARSARGTDTTYTFSLLGVTASTNRIDECG